MKVAKQLKVSAGVTRIRITLGKTQLALAHCVGVSKSLISMVENGRRNLPAAALKIITQLEMGLQPAPAGETITTATKPAPKSLSIRKQTAINIYRLRLQELQYELNSMNRRYETLIASLQSIQQLVGLPYHSRESRAGRALAFQVLILEQKMQSCNYIYQTKKEARIAMLERLIKGAQKSVALMGKDIELPSIPAIVGCEVAA